MLVFFISPIKSSGAGRRAAVASGPGPSRGWGLGEAVRPRPWASVRAAWSGPCPREDATHFIKKKKKSSGAMGSSNVKTEREDHEFCLIETCPNFNGVFRGYTASTEEQNYCYSTFCCLPKNMHVWQGAKQVQNTTELQ